jgi:hypothetical protein
VATVRPCPFAFISANTSCEASKSRHGDEHFFHGGWKVGVEKE